MANSYYADLDGTTFPDAIDSWEKFLDPTASSQAAINSYYNCINNGDFSGAATVLEQNPRLNQMIINAKRMNQIRDAVISLERFFDDTVYTYIADLTKDMGTWAVNTTYKKYSVVDYNIGGANLYFIAIKDVPKNVSPTNTTYWKSMTIKGDKGDSGLGLVPRGSWSNTIQYSQYDFVAYNNSLWYATEDNINDTPTETSDSWVLLMNVSDIYSEDMLITLPKDRWGEVDGVYVNTISAQSSTSDMQPIYGLVPAGEKAIENEIEAYSHIYALVCGDGYINVYSDEPLDITLSLILKNCMIKSAGFSPNDYAALVQNVERIDGDVESNKQEVDAKFKEIDEGIGKTVEGLEDKIKEIDEGIGKTVEDLEDKISKAVSNVDTVLSYTSINPVQNRVITAELNKKVSSVDGMGLSHNDFTDDYKKAIDNSMLNDDITVYFSSEKMCQNIYDNPTSDGTKENPYISIANFTKYTSIPRNLNGHMLILRFKPNENFSGFNENAGVGLYGGVDSLNEFYNGIIYITKDQDSQGCISFSYAYFKNIRCALVIDCCDNMRDSSITKVGIKFKSLEFRDCIDVRIYPSSGNQGLLNISGSFSSYNSKVTVHWVWLQASQIIAESGSIISIGGYVSLSGTGTQRLNARSSIIMIREIYSTLINGTTANNASTNWSASYGGRIYIGSQTKLGNY